MKLHLIVKKKWYDMIVSGEKKEEYRLHNLYWHRRIMKQSIIDSVVFHRGYTCITHERECLRVREGIGKPEWGAPEGEVIILELGKEVRY